jgi:hypothetical protein
MQTHSKCNGFFSTMERLNIDVLSPLGPIRGSFSPRVKSPRLAHLRSASSKADDPRHLQSTLQQLQAERRVWATRRAASLSRLLTVRIANGSPEMRRLDRGLVSRGITPRLKLPPCSKIFELPPPTPFGLDGRPLTSGTLIHEMLFGDLSRPPTSLKPLPSSRRASRAMRRPLLEEKDELFPVHVAMKVADEGADLSKDLSADPAVVLDLAASSRTAEPRARTPSTVAFLDDSHRRSDGVMEEMVSATSIKPPNAEGLTEGSRQQDQGGEGMLEARTPVSYTRARTRTRSDETLAKSSCLITALQHEEPRRSDSKRHSDRHSDGTEDGNTALADVASHLPPGSEAPAQHLAIQEAVGTIVDTIVVQDEETRQDTHKDIPDKHGEMSELRTAPVLTPAREVPKDQPTKEESKESSAEEATLVNVQVIAASEVNREVNVATEEAAGDESTQEAKHVDHVDTETAADSGHHEPAEEKHSEHVAAEEAEAGRVAAEDAEAVRVATEEVEAVRVATEEAGAVRVAAEEADAAEEAEAVRVATEEAGAVRVAAEEADAERVATEEAEAVRVAAEEADAERVAAEEAEAVRVAAAEYAEAEEARRRGPSAVKIQSRARGKRGRKKAKQRAEATETIQAHARGGAARKKTNPMREKKRAEEARKRVAAEKAEAERLKAVRLAENAEAARLKAETSKLEAEQAEAKAATGGATTKRVATQKRLVADKDGEAADKEGEVAAAHAAVMARKQERAAKKEAARLEWIAQQGSGESAR